jgi:hypothetical protein
VLKQAQRKSSQPWRACGGGERSSGKQNTNNSVSSQVCLPSGLQDESVVTRKHAKFIVQLNLQLRTDERGTELPMPLPGDRALTHTSAQQSTGAKLATARTWTQDESTQN